MARITYERIISYKQYPNCDAANDLEQQSLEFKKQQYPGLGIFLVFVLLGVGAIQIGWQVPGTIILLLGIVLSILYHIFYPRYLSNKAEKVFQEHDERMKAITSVRTTPGQGYSLIMEHNEEDLTSRIMDKTVAAESPEQAVGVFLIKKAPLKEDVIREKHLESDAFALLLVLHDRINGKASDPVFFKIGELRRADHEQLRAVMQDLIERMEKYHSYD